MSLRVNIPESASYLEPSSASPFLYHVIVGLGMLLAEHGREALFPSLVVKLEGGPVLILGKSGYLNQPQELDSVQ